MADKPALPVPKRAVRTVVRGRVYYVHFYFEHFTWIPFKVYLVIGSDSQAIVWEKGDNSDDAIPLEAWRVILAAKENLAS